MSIVKFKVMHEKVLGIDTYRGTGRLVDIAMVSEPDIFDQKKNPKGTERDLNKKHARDAYKYVKNNNRAFWPEVVLCCRNENLINFTNIDSHSNFGILSIDLDILEKNKENAEISISRLDGNHRLHYATGGEKGFEPILELASFCLLLGLTRDEEIKIFRDINNNQRRMLTSHLDNIVIQLTPEEELIKEKPFLYIAKKLGNDSDSPFQGRVYEGGVKTPDLHIPLRTLSSGIRYLFEKSTKINLLDDIEAEYTIVRNFWNALKLYIPEAWERPKDFLLLRGAGLWGISMLGGYVIDSMIEQDKFSIEEIYTFLSSGKSWDWSNSGDFSGLSGKNGANLIANKINSELVRDSEYSLKKLAQKIKG